MKNYLDLNKKVLAFTILFVFSLLNVLSATTEKREMRGKEIVFVYITNTSSPKKLWEEKINGIGGEHYYLTQEEWESVMDSLDFDAIPTYLFYNADGVLKEKVTAYPGSEKMQRMIEELLP